MKKFGSWKRENESNNVITYDYIIGVPSGEVIYVEEDELIKLKKEQLIIFDYKLKCFIFHDEHYKKIKKFLIPGFEISKIKEFMRSLNISETLYEINNEWFDHSPQSPVVDVKCDVNMSGLGIKKIPIKFGIVEGNFNCSSNNLENIVNSPNIVTGNFICSSNKIYTLIGGPEHVGGSYICMDNKLTNLQGFPITCNIGFDASHNLLTSLKGTPEKLTAKFFIVSYNKLRSLADGPKYTYNYYCSHNEIVTLSGGVRHIIGDFDCTYNKLYNLMGKPKCHKIIYRKGNFMDEYARD